MNANSLPGYTTLRSKRKRAEVACETCHQKKVKCDLQVRIKNRYEGCSNCVAWKKECRPRQSKRQRARSDAVMDMSQRLSCRSNTDGSLSQPTFVPTLSPANESHERHESSLQDSDTVGAATLSEVLTSPDNPSDLPNGALAENSRIRSPLTTSSIISTHAREDYQRSYPSDIGFLQVYGPENQQDAMNQDVAHQARRQSNTVDIIPPQGLLQSFIEVYFEYCYTWCPVLDKNSISDDLAASPMLANALAVAASHVQPPMIPHPGSASYYNQAKQLFYDDAESNLMIALKALSLFYWWSPKPPTAVHKNSSWWWQSVIIRHAQQLGIHREPALDHPLRPEIDISLRRRIWWTAFARERLTAMCQSKPVIIDPNDCSVGELTLMDFPDTEHHYKAEIFIQWVKLCGIIGRIAKRLSQGHEATSSNYPHDLARELIVWVNSLPNHLVLPINATTTTTFNRDVQQLYLPYLAVVVVLHLEGSTDPFPRAHPPAIMAASCIARILNDILTRGAMRYLMAITCWYTGIAFLGLLSASRMTGLSESANSDLDILTFAIKQLRQMWPTANIFDQGFKRLRLTAAAIPKDSSNVSFPNHADHGFSTDARASENAAANVSRNNIDWTEFFPFATPSTSDVARELFAAAQGHTFFESQAFPDLMISHFQDLFEPFDDMVEMSLFT